MIAIGLVAIVVPVVPGLLLVYAAVLVWAFVAQRWVTLAVVTVVVAATIAVKYVWPVRRMRRADVPVKSVIAGALLGIVGFFVVPVLGLVLGFVLGVYLAEFMRCRDQRRARDSTVHAVRAAALSVGVELAGALAVAAIWLAAVVFT